MGVGVERMRIVGGEWRRRPIKAPKGDLTRPTTDRVREALFSALTSRLGLDLGQAVVLDAFAGSGALGLEALSRGASRAVLAEHHRSALSALKDNVAALGAGGRARVVQGDVFSLAGRGGLGGPFSLILLDPPYTLDQAKVGRLLDVLAESGAVAEGAWVTWEHASGAQMPWPEGFVVDSVKKYGSTEIDIASYGGGSR